MKIPNVPGVYCLKAVTSKLIYIGSTKNLRTRRNTHIYQINKGDIKRGSESLMKAFHAGDYIIFNVVEVCDNYLEREQYWINFYKQQDTFTLINQFDAIRNGSSITESFKEKMSDVAKKRWKNPTYRKKMLAKIKPTQFTTEKMSKPVHVFAREGGSYIATYKSAKQCSKKLQLREEYVGAAARGKYAGKYCVREWIIIYDEVLNKLDELLETHQELRAISSEAWEAIKSTMNVQRLMSEQASNNLNTSVQHL